MRVLVHGRLELQLQRRKAGPSSPTSSLSAGNKLRNGVMPLGVRTNVAQWAQLVVFFYSSETGPRCSSPVNMDHSNAEGGQSPGPEKACE